MQLVQREEMRKIQMVDLKSQYQRLKTEIDANIQEVLDHTSFIKGPAVHAFEKELAEYLGVKHVIGCANGTDALQIAMMALDLPSGSEVITPSFSYAALVEVIYLLKLKPVYIEVERDTFLMDPEKLEDLITENTSLIAPVHLYGQCANMEAINAIAKKHKIKVIEDTAQAIGASYTMQNGDIYSAGTMSDIGTTSFFPSKNLGCFGDGGAVMTNNDELARIMRMVANHGQSKKYVHQIIGLNSRLDSIQAAVLRVKLKNLKDFENARNKVAMHYDKNLERFPLQVPNRVSNSTHVFHQYTIRLDHIEDRNKLKEYLAENDIPSMIYYPIALHKQEAYFQNNILNTTDDLCDRVLSLPISTEMDESQLIFITNTIKNYFNK